MTNRLIKKEVIDTAELVEKMTKIMLMINTKVDQN